MKQYQVIVDGSFIEYFPAENEEEAEAYMMREIPRDFVIDYIEVREI